MLVYKRHNIYFLQQCDPQKDHKHLSEQPLIWRRTSLISKIWKNSLVASPPGNLHITSQALKTSVNTFTICCDTNWLSYLKFKWTNLKFHRNFFLWSTKVCRHWNFVELIQVFKVLFFVKGDHMTSLFLATNNPRSSM